MTTVLSVVAMAVLFVVFGLLRAGEAGQGCGSGHCDSCSTGSCDVGCDLEAGRLP